MAAGTSVGDGQQEWLNMSETVLNILGHVTALITATLNLHNSRFNEVNTKPAAVPAVKYMKIQSV